MDGFLFDSLCEDFEVLHELLTQSKNIQAPKIRSTEELEKSDDIEVLEYMESLVERGNPFQVLADYYNHIDKIIERLNSINHDWVKQYLFDRETFKDKPTDFPEIYMLFVSFIKSVKEENYIESGRLKKLIINYK